MSKSKSGISFAVLKNELQKEELPALANAGLINPDTIDYLESFRRHYEAKSPELADSDRPYYASNTDHYDMIVRKEVGKNLRKAVQNGNNAVVNHAVGMVKSNYDMSGMQAYEKLRNLIKPKAQIFIWAGAMGKGKTASASVILKQFNLIHDSSAVATNIKSMAESEDDVDFVGGQSELEEWARDTVAAHKMVLLDEMSSHATGRGSDSYRTGQQLGKFARKMRKDPYNLSMAIIGHRTTDIDPSLRNGEIANFVMKPTLKEMEIYDGINNSGSFEDKILEINNLKDNGYHYDTDERTSWKWKDDKEDGESVDISKERKDAKKEMRNEQIRRLAKSPDGFTQRKIAEIVGCSSATVNIVLSQKD